MSGKTTELNRQSRKQLLVVESELNRTQLAADWNAVKTGLEEVAQQVIGVASLAESAAKIGTSFAGFFRGFSGDKDKAEGKKRSWISTMFHGARAGFSLWSSVRSHFGEK